MGPAPLLANVLLRRTGLAKASLLRAALLLRVEEIETGGDPSKMPKSLAPLFEKQGDPPPLDYLGETLESQIEYIPDPQEGTYILRHSPASKGEKPFEFKGEWSRERVQPDK